MYRVDINQAMDLQLPVSCVAVDKFLVTEWDDAFKTFDQYKDMLDKLCEQNDGRYFIELEYDRKFIEITYIYYANTN